MKIEKLDTRLDTLGYSVLKDIKAMYKDAVIAGGYVRDLVNNKPFNDIDIFVPKVFMPKTLFPEGYKMVNSSIESFGEKTEYENMNFTVYNLTYLESVTVQLIVTNFKPDAYFTEHLMNSFDFGLCQVYSDGKSIYGTDNFLKDVKYQTMTLLNLTKITQLPKAMSRFNKIKEKYSSFAFQCPNLSIKQPEKKKTVKEAFPNLAPQGVTETYHPLTLTVDAILTWNIADLLKPNGSLDWKKIDAAQGLSSTQVDLHIHELLNDWDGNEAH